MSGQVRHQNIVDGQSVQTTIEEGEWLSLKEAAAKTGLSQKTLRRYVKKKTLKTKRLGKSINSPIQVYITSELVSAKEEVEEAAIEEATVEPEDHETEQEHDDEIEEDLDFSPSMSESDFELQRQVFRTAIDECMKPLLNRIEEQAEQISQQDKQLKLLPDLEKIAREKEEAEKLKAFENETLKKQLELIQEEKKKAEELAEVSKSLAEEKDEKQKLLESELEKIKAEFEEAKKPWWKKWFAPQEIPETE